MLPLPKARVIYNGASFAATGHVTDAMAGPGAIHRTLTPRSEQSNGKKQRPHLTHSCACVTFRSRSHLQRVEFSFICARSASHKCAAVLCQSLLSFRCPLCLPPRAFETRGAGISGVARCAVQREGGCCFDRVHQRRHACGLSHATSLCASVYLQSAPADIRSQFHPL